MKDGERERRRNIDYVKQGRLNKALPAQQLAKALTMSRACMHHTRRRRGVQDLLKVIWEGIAA
jgi:hypothetical protein